MPVRRAWFRRLWAEQPGLRRGYLMDVATALLMGSLLIIGGRDRTTAASWATLNANGGPIVWGVVLAALGAALIAATFWRPGAVVVVLVVLAGFYGLLALWFLQSALPVESGSSFVAAVFASRDAGMHLSRAWAYREGPERPLCPACGQREAAE